MPDETAQQCAARVLDTMHLMMRAIGPEIRKSSPGGLSMQQFRAMIGIKHKEGSSLSELAEGMGTSISATSKLIDGLVELGFITRETDPEDRRKLVLDLTQAGEDAMASIHICEHKVMAGKLASLTAGECAMVELAMTLLRSALVQTQGTECQR